MKSLKLIHCADLHLDAPFREYGPGAYAETRRRDIRNAFAAILERVKEENADMLLVSGDLYEQGTVTRSTMEWLSMKLSQVNTPVILLPGNHDPYIANSWYRNWEWPSNVRILSHVNPSFISDDKRIHIFGIGFSSFKADKPDLSKVPAPMKGYFNILMVHGTLDMDFTGQAYHPVTSGELGELGYDYYALGHFHNTRSDYALKNAINPGSPEPLGFDEPGIHGAFSVTLFNEDDRIRVDAQKFVTARRVYQDRVLDTSGCKTLEEVKIRLLGLMEGLDPARDITRITLKGNTDLTLEPETLSLLVNEEWLCLKLRNETRKAFDIEGLVHDPSLTGAFAREMKGRLGSIHDALAADPSNQTLHKEEERLGKALLYGLEALRSGKIEWWNE